APVVRARFSPDGRHVGTASLDYTARIWNAATGECLHVLKAHNGGGDNVLFSPDGSRLLTHRHGVGYTSKPHGVSSFSNNEKQEDFAGCVWDVATGKQMTTLRWPGDTRAFVGTAAFSPDGKRIVTPLPYPFSGYVPHRRPYVWDAENGKQLFPL